MLKRVGVICAALVVAAAAFSTSVEARSGAYGGVRAGGFGGGGARMGGGAELILAAHVLVLATLAVPVWAASMWAVRA